jgi:hypothetical protein
LFREKNNEEEKNTAADSEINPNKSTEQKLEEELQHYQKDTRAFFNVDTNCRVINKQFDLIVRVSYLLRSILYFKRLWMSKKWQILLLKS